MTVLPNLEIFETYLLNSRNRTFSDINAILFNSNNCLLITPNYLDKLESEFEDNELIKSLIVQLSDENRITENYIDNSSDNFIEQLFTDNISNIDCLFPICLTNKPNDSFFCYDEINKASKNKHYIIFELLKNNQLSLHYYDFRTNDEIEHLLKCIFNLPKNLSRIKIFNRYSEYNNIVFLKNKSIHYYNLIRGNRHQRKIDYIEIERELKQHLGRNVVLKSTNNSTIIHERKIFFNHFIITFDQALNNLLVTEPNWKIDIQVDRLECLIEWSKKERHFARLN